MSSPNTTIYQAKKIITMNPDFPEATHVAVRDGKILAVGDLDELMSWDTKAVLDDSFKDKVIMPGLVEAHSHLLEGGMWSYTYIGYYDRVGPDGQLWKGLKSFDDVVTRLKEAEKKLIDPNQILVAWGFDPIYFKDQRFHKSYLDKVSTSRPILVMHASMHILHANSKLLELAEVTDDLELDGICKDEQGQLTGELQEFSAMYLVYRKVGNLCYLEGQSEQGMLNFARVAQIAGVTTATDLANDLSDASIDMFNKVTSDSDYPIRLVPAYAPTRDPENKALDRILPAQKFNSSKLHIGIVKLILDGSIQGFTARLSWPHYYQPPVGAEKNGIWLLAPDELKQLIKTYHDAGLTVHIHTNGDEATEVALDAIESILQESPRWDHRHTLQHCQMASRDQFKRMSKLGVCVNLFANHLYYWGDAHYEKTMGPERANRMNNAKAALDENIPFSLHSDAPITPMSPLFTAWCAVNRITATGRVLGPEHRISVQDALYAVTMGGAFTLKLEDKIGSIEVGKQADFAILDEDPLSISPEKLKDINIWGTMFEGKVFQSPR